VRVLSTLFFACLLMIPHAGYCQTVTGNIVGTVTDATGSVIPGARVVAKNVDTGIETASTTNKEGAYSILFLPLGNYQFTVSAPGFKSQQFPTFVLELDKTANIDAKLEVGSATTTVQVEAGNAQLLNTSDASLGIVLSSSEIESVPLIADNFAALAVFQPGAVNTAPTGFNSAGRDGSGEDTTSQNGNRYQDNNYIFEGIPINQNGNNLIGYNPAPEALQEVKVISANASVEYGDVAGGAMLSQLKSGTSHFHGAAYEHLQNQSLDANSWGNKYNTPVIPRNPYTQSIFGGTFGGPVPFTHKLFFFGDYQGLREHTAGLGSGSVLTAAMRTGDFSVLLNPPSVGGRSASPIQLYDTQNNFAPYVNNQIPISNPIAEYLIAHPSVYPLPNAAPSDGIMASNYQAGASSYNINNQWDLKFEWDPRNADKFTVFYTDSQPHTGGAAFLPVSFPSLNKYPTHVTGGSWSHVFSPAVVNLAHAGFSRINFSGTVPTDPSGQFGTSGDSIVGIPLPWTQTWNGFTQQSINGLTTLGTNANFSLDLVNQFYYDDMVTWQHGTHLITMGAQALRIQEDLWGSNYGFLGIFSYSGLFSSNPNAASGGTGYAPADFELNRITTAEIAENGGEYGTREWRVFGFAQDSWRVNHALTVNFGLRYQYYQPWYEVHNLVGDVVASGPNKGLVQYAGSVPAGAPAGSVVCPNRACFFIDNRYFLPRVSLAWQAPHGLVVRAGYGATGNLEGNDALPGPPPYQLSFYKTALTPTATSGGSPYTAQSGFTSVPGSPFYSTNGGLAIEGPTIAPQFVQQWNLTLGYELNSNTSLNVGYVGSKATQLGAYGNANQLTSPGATAPYAALVGQGGDLVIEGTWGYSTYNALQATLRQRTAHGLSYTVNYTYSKSLADSIGFYGGYNVSGPNGSAQNGYDWPADYGPSDWDLRHNLTAIASYDLPFGRGKTFASHANRLEDAVVGGWRLSGSTTNYSGFPIEINGPSEINVNSQGQPRADQYRHFAIRHRSLQHWWGTDPSAVPCTQSGVDNGVCAYGVPAENTFGSAGVNTERAPGYHQVDMSFYKDFHVTEGQFFTFRADFFNAFNISSYGVPSNNISYSNFGQITGVNSPSRNIQLSLKYSF
jgi:hypothetical protein